MSNVVAPVTGTVWRVLISPGQDVVGGQEIIILESMKMEIPVAAADTGVITAVHVEEGTAVTTGEVLAVIGP